MVRTAVSALLALFLVAGCGEWPPTRLLVSTKVDQTAGTCTAQAKSNQHSVDELLNTAKKACSPLYIDCSLSKTEENRTRRSVVTVVTVVCKLRGEEKQCSGACRGL